MAPGSGNSAPSASAGTISVPRSIARTCITFSASGMRAALKAKMMKGTASGALLVKIYVVNFLILAYTARPSSTAWTIDAKLSSIRIMSAASLATSVPTIPIATPMSAFFRAGASFTPSPVTATTCPSSCITLTTRSLCSGAALANTTSLLSASFKEALSIVSNSTPEIMRGRAERRMPILRAILSAVSP